MAASGINPWSGIKLFEVTAKDGRRVCLHETWYYVHMIQRKHEIGWLTEPLEEIKRAVIDAAEIRLQANANVVYVGPYIGRGFCRDNRLHVAVHPTGVIFTVIMK